MRDEPVLVVPDGMRISDLSRLRLEHQLRRAPAHVDGIAAPRSALPSGCSYRVYSERLALQPLTAVSQPTDRPDGAVLLRPGIGDDDAGSEPGSILVDRGAHTHDPALISDELGHASPLGRSPFPSRPVVVLLDHAADPAVVDAAAPLVDDLLELDVEARLAVTAPSAHSRLSQPCLASRESLEALRPDLVLALDAGALDDADQWLGADRTATVIAWEHGLDSSHELVSWRIGRASGRLRARVGPRIEATELASLILRLVAGPHPIPPALVSVEPRRPSNAPTRGAETRVRSGPQRRRVVVALTGVVETMGAERIRGLRDSIEAGGDVLDVHDVDTGAPPDAVETPVLLLHGVVGSAKIEELASARRARGLATVVDLAPTDVTVGATGLELTPASQRLVERCRLAITPSTTLASALLRQAPSGEALQVRVAPTLLSPAQHRDLVRLRADRVRAGLVIGWHVGSGGPTTPDGNDAVAESLAELLDRWSELRVRIVGDPRRMPTLLHDARVDIHPGPVHRSEIARWTLQIWTPDRMTVELSGNRRPLVKASCLGVPTLMDADNPAVADGVTAPELVVTDDDWLGPISRILDDDRSLARLGDQLERRADALFGPAESVAAAKDLLDWAMRAAR